FFPVIKGIPLLCVETFLDYGKFLTIHLPDYSGRKDALLSKFGGLLRQVVNKNRRTRESFTREWRMYKHEKDKTWDAGDAAMLDRFL
ncbi:MAG: hypothetical protein WKI04_16325, partial [Ferruginibacter sp.]